MYQVIGIKSALSLFALLCVAIIAVWSAIVFSQHPPQGGWQTVEAIWKIGSGSVSVAALFVAVVGQTPIFPVVCQLPLVDKWFPPIDGEWAATLQSNWPAIQQRAQPDSPPLQLVPISAKVQIIVRLFYVRMNLTSADRYSTSKTLFVRASRDSEDGSVTLYYLYRNKTPLPKSTDSDGHEGAAILTVEKTGGEIWLDGVYWTNRNWHQGLNTAGKITLRRA